MVKNFIPTCDLCGREVSPDRYVARRVAGDGMEVLMVALSNPDPDLDLRFNRDGTVTLDRCFDCYAGMAHRISKTVN